MTSGENDADPVATVTLSRRDLNALRWTVPILRGVEEQWSELAGTREGEATSDVLAAIVARADLEKGEAR